MTNLTCERSIVWGALPLLLLISQATLAVDAWEPDNSFSVNSNPWLFVGAPPQTRDLESFGGVPDNDWLRIAMRPFRSYEVRIWNSKEPTPAFILARYDATGTTSLQVAGSFFVPGTEFGDSVFLRWEMGGPLSGYGALVNAIRVIGVVGATANGSSYTINSRDTTLFCPRFNNTGSQVSVLIVQAALEGANTCNFTAHFFSEAGSRVGQQAGTLDVDGKVVVINTAGVAGVASQKGGAQITHTCGYGNLKAKLVALEPATGFSFDTPCTMREQ